MELDDLQEQASCTLQLWTGVGLVVVVLLLGALVYGLRLGTVKVNNELRMTEMYERQAVALEALAAQERHHTNRKTFVYICRSVPQYGQLWEVWLSHAITTGACGRAR